MDAVRSLLLTIMLATGAAATQGSTLSYQQGIARKPHLAVELYREQHWLRSEAGHPVERLVVYRCADGTAFARKYIDYRNSRLAPAFVMEDMRTGYREGLRRSGATVLFHQDGHAAAEQQGAIADGPLVADAGFDEFVHAHWAELVAGKIVPIQFAVPARLRSWPFTVSRVGQATVNGEKAWVFRLKFSSWLAWVAPSLDISYGQGSGRLLRFEGVTNLRSDSSGARPVQARIDFAQAPQPTEATAWQSALRLPLSACRVGQ